jgi:predicted outer membrane repeat protein
LRITDSTAEVRIRGLYFKDGLATDYGGAIYNTGILTLESCIFSGNRTTASYAYGGALYSTNTLTIRGCTFYGNTAGSSGGAVYFLSSEKTLTLTGNLFYGNTATNYPVVHNLLNVGTVNASYNVVDAAFGTGTAQAGWAAGTGDTAVTALPVSGKSFRLLYGSEAGARLPAVLPANYPVTDFYGNPISGGGAAGAVQGSTAHGSGYYYLEVSVNNSLGGNVTVSSTPDADGLYPAGFISITASPKSGYSLGYWLVNGIKTGVVPTSLSTHSFVQAVFNRAVTVNVFTDGAGSAAAPTLRYALTNAQAGDIITLSGVTAGTTVINLTSALPEITKSLTIVGNGVTLTRASSWTASSGTSQLLRISTAEVLVRKIHFKDGLATDHGGAISNSGNLTLESCIFSGNRTTVSYAYGGALYSTNTLTIRGCTFYGNTAGSRSGAVYFSASGQTLTLTGNLFYGNTAASMYPVVYVYGTVNASYNVVDAALGTGSTYAGWDAGTGDKTTLADSDDLTITGNPFNTTTFVPVTGLSSILPATAPTDFPTTDFYGATRTFPGAPGAVK